MKVRADKLDLKIRALHPANPVYMAWTNRDQHSTMFANVIPTEQYNLPVLKAADSALRESGRSSQSPRRGPYRIQEEPEGFD